MTALIILNRGYFSAVDDEDADLRLFTWSAYTSKGLNVYANRNIRCNGKKQTIILHRVILSRKLGIELATNQQCDHIDGNGLNNVRSNLRLATLAENNRNKRIPVTNESGHLGVYWHAKRGKWRAGIQVNRRTIWLGEYADIAEAVAARRNAEVKYFGDFSPAISRGE